MRHERHRPVFYRLGRLELEAHAQSEVSEDLLAQLDRLDSRLQASKVPNQPTIDALNTLPIDVYKLIEQQSSLPNGPSQESTTNQSETTHTQQDPSYENSHTIAPRAKARTETIDLLFSTCQTSADLTPMELAYLFTDVIAKVSLENIE